MFIWNRAEIVVTLSKEYYLRVRALLQQHDIKLQTQQLTVRGQQPQMQTDILQRPAMQYHIYVHQDDVPKASELIRAMGPEDGFLTPVLEW